MASASQIPPQLPKMETKTKKNNYFLYLTAVTASLISFVSGISYAWSSPVLPQLEQEDNPLGRVATSTEISWIASILSIGSLFSTVIFGFLADKIGRKKTLLALACPMVISLLMLAFARTVTMFYIGRIFMGLCAGGGFTIVPMYLTEVAEDHNRGALGCLMSVFVGFGNLFSYTVGSWLTIENFCLVCLIPMMIFFPIFLIWIPESPQYLALINDQKNLEACLLKIRNKTTSEVEKEVTESIATAQRTTKGAILDLFRSRSSRHGLLVTVLLILFQQFSGINAVLSYMQTIFSAAGSDLSPELSSIIVALVQILAIVLASFIIDKLGRRILLLTSSVGSGLASTTLGLYFHLKSEEYDVSAISWLPVSSLLLFIISFNVGLSCVPWTIMVELFPPSFKAIATIFTGVVCFIACFLITLFFPAISVALGMAMSFWIFAIVCGVATLFIYFVVPETKGKSVQEIQRLLEWQEK